MILTFIFLCIMKPHTKNLLKKGDEVCMKNELKANVHFLMA
ncbi:hypothetical protein BCG9842_B2196 [Bacillus cereus G9842]|uniref:Uncharacterized protein n=1 Tax=Bacillus cereus (strain G9842) TaxID=405531 RepID=B7ILQ7_BACC2|nr:hypothetical protein BCG9842_B2196 [Bacillus cereus G9842]